jgi:hypothetical protein
MTTIDDTGGGEHAQRVGVSIDVELKPSRGIERPSPIGADLGAEPAVAEKGKSAPRGGAAPEVEMERPVAAAAQVETAGGMEERRELRSPIALALGGDRRELLPDVLRRDQSETPSRVRSRRLTSTPALP